MRNNRIFMPGDRWLYLRIYTGYRMADDILLKVLYPLVNNLEKDQLIRQWFFVRYADPDFHLRFRLQIKDPAQTSVILSTMRTALLPYIESWIVWKLEVGTYIPEFERYGKYAMESIETLFYADSKSFLNFLEENHSDQDHRWHYALMSVDRLLSNFGIGPEEKKDLLLNLSRSFGKEFGKDRVLARQLSARYRENRELINSLLGRHAPRQFESILKKREMNCRREILGIKEMSASGKNEISLQDLLGSLIHMNMNRIFQTRNRMYEMVLYDFLFRHYKSALAMAKGYTTAVSR